MRGWPRVVPSYAPAYDRRGVARYGMNDYRGAVADLTHAAVLFAAQHNNAAYAQVQTTIAGLPPQR